MKTSVDKARKLLLKERTKGLVALYGPEEAVESYDSILLGR